jgi:excisionase family DNA binding protein
MAQQRPPKAKAQATPHKALWRVNEWAADVGLSRARVYELLNEKKIKSVKCGARRLINTTPAEFAASLENA